MPVRALALLTAIGLLAVLGLAGPAIATPGDAIISNGTVMLGIHPEAHLNVPGPPSSGGTPFVGVRHVPTNAEATAPGCLCEGWGAADAISGVTGYANVAIDGVVNITPISFVATATTALSVVQIGTTLRVTHDYHPSLMTPNLYEVVVTIENISSAAVEPRYRRVMDWDVEPTAFDEFVTAQIGTAAFLLDNNNDGFTTANPLGSDTSGAIFGCSVVSGNFVDHGPCDNGARFDFGFPSLAPGANRQFKIFYGGGATELQADAAVTAVGAEVYSYGQCNMAADPVCSQTTGTPNTFIFAFGGVGGTPVFDTPLDHFKCYGSIEPTHPGAGRSVTLEDQFGNSTASIGRVYNLCNPVDKNDEGINQPDAHLVEYKLYDRRAASGRFIKRRVAVENQFGTLTLTVQKPNRLMVPSSKAIFPDVPGAIPEKLDHFLCYKVHASSAFTWRTPTLKDQFMTERATVKKPRMLCNPVSKNGEGIQSKEEHLVCYAARGHATPTRRSVTTRNQFGVTSLRPYQTRHLCVPSKKREL